MGGTHSSFSTQDEDGEDELREHAYDDGVPLDQLAILGRRPEEEDEDHKSKARNRAVGARVVRRLLRHHRPDEDHGDGADGAQRQAETGGDHVHGALHDVLPDEGDGDHGVAGGDVEGHEADHDEEPEEEGDEPAVVVAVEGEACNPPSVGVSCCPCHASLMRCHLAESSGLPLSDGEDGIEQRDRELTQS